MKKGKDIQALAAEISRQAETKKDFLAKSDSLHVRVKADEIKEGEPAANENARLVMDLGTNGGRETYSLRDTAHAHLSERLEIPRRYYDRMRRTDPDLLSINVNRWLDHGGKKTRMIRTLDGGVRAVLSDRYRRLDNIDLAEAVLPAMSDAGVEVTSTEITDRRLYIHAVTPKLEGEVTKGDVVKAGIVVSNSEIGGGAIKIEPLIWRLACLNGMITKQAMRQAHVGRGYGDNFDSETWELFSDETRNLTDAAFWSRVRERVQIALSNVSVFNGEIEKLREAAGLKIETTDLEAVRDITTKTLKLSDGEGKSFLRNLINGSALNKWGVANAVTAIAHEPDVGYDRSVELERAGSTVIELGKADWRRIAEGVKVAA